MTCPSAAADDARVIDAALVGLVNVGKSSLINALARRELSPTSPIGGTTTTVATAPWRAVMAAVGPFLVRLIDTPGLQEVEGTARERSALDAATRADLVLFVTDEDLTASALGVVRTLRSLGKPMLVAVNKMDLRDPEQRAVVLAAVRRSLQELVPSENVIAVAAAPLLRQRVIGPDGQARREYQRDAPWIAELERQLVAAIAATAPDLKDLAEASNRVEAHRTQSLAERGRRRAEAERLADRIALVQAMALAVNPVPLVDLLTSSGSLVLMVRQVAQVYEEPISAAMARQIASELYHGGRLVFWGSLSAMGLAGALKLVPGLGHVAGALTQAAAGRYVFHVLGRALVDYFENGHDWGEGGLVATLNRIAAATDRHALTRGLADQLRQRLIP